MIFKSTNDIETMLRDGKQKIINILLDIVSNKNNKYSCEKVYVDSPTSNKFYFDLRLNDIKDFTFEIQKTKENLSKKNIVTYIVTIKDPSDNVIVEIKSISINDKLIDSFGVNNIYNLLDTKFNEIESRDENIKVINILNKLK